VGMMPYIVTWRDPRTGHLETSRVFEHHWEAKGFAVQLTKKGVEWWSIRWIPPV